MGSASREVTEALPPAILAAYLGAELLIPGDIPGMPSEALDQLLIHDPQGWSAVTVNVDSKPTVIYNPISSPGRQASDIMHELMELSTSEIAQRYGVTDTLAKFRMSVTGVGAQLKRRCG